MLERFDMIREEDGYPCMKKRPDGDYVDFYDVLEMIDSMIEKNISMVCTDNLLFRAACDLAVIELKNLRFNIDPVGTAEKYADDIYKVVDDTILGT